MAKKKRLLKWYVGMEGNVYAQGIDNVKKNGQQSTLTYMLVNVLYQLKYFNVPTGEKIYILILDYVFLCERLSKWEEF